MFSVLAVPSASQAGGPGTWTKLVTVDNGADTVGMLRTADGTLHLAWLAKRASNTTQSIGTSTISLSGKLVATGTAVSGWGSLEQDPQLVRDGSALRLVFEGGTGTTGCFSLGLVYTAISADGSHWNLVTGSLSSHSAGIGNLAATARGGRNDAGGDVRRRSPVPRRLGSQLPRVELRRHDRADGRLGPSPIPRLPPTRRAARSGWPGISGRQAGLLGGPDPPEPGRTGRSPRLSGAPRARTTSRWSRSRSPHGPAVGSTWPIAPPPRVSHAPTSTCGRSARPR